MCELFETSCEVRRVKWPERQCDSTVSVTFDVKTRQTFELGRACERHDRVILRNLTSTHHSRSPNAKFRAADSTTTPRADSNRADNRVRDPTSTSKSGRK